MLGVSPFQDCLHTNLVAGLTECKHMCSGLVQGRYDSNSSKVILKAILKEKEVGFKLSIVVGRVRKSWLSQRRSHSPPILACLFTLLLLPLPLLLLFPLHIQHLLLPSNPFNQLVLFFLRQRPRRPVFPLLVIQTVLVIMLILTTEGRRSGAIH